MKKFKNGKEILIISLLVLGILVAVVFSYGKNNNNINENKTVKISAKEAKDIIDSEDNVIILDVRTKEEYESEHILGSILIPVDNLNNEAKDKLKDKNQKILVYCRSGNRSKKAAEKLRDMGYTNVFDFGGINEWSYEKAK